MNPIRALLWKEGREAAYKIAAGAGLALVAGLASRQTTDFSGGFSDIVIKSYLMSHLVGILGAVLMGVGVVADERSRGTLPFLLSRPLGSGWLLGVKFAVGAAGLLGVLAAYWAGVYAMPVWGNFNFLSEFFLGPLHSSVWVNFQEVLADVGYLRMLLLWFFLYVVLYAAVFLASAFTDYPLKAAMTGLMVAWVGLFFLGSAWMLAPRMARFYFGLVFYSRIYYDAGILRQAFDPSLFLARGAVAALLAAGVLLWARRGLRVQTSRRFQWTAGGLALICGVIVVGLVATKYPVWESVKTVEPVGQLPYKVSVVDLALRDGLAVVLLKRGVSVVDVADPRAPAEVGRVKIKGWRLERLALFGSTAYVYGKAQDSVGVAVFDLSRPECPQLQAQSLLYPIEKGPTPWLRRIPRLVGWAVWKGHLYAGLLGNEFLELHSFDVREGGLPQPVHVLPLEKTTRHFWDSDWEMRLAGPHAFLTLGHDLVVLDLTDPGRPEELSRTPLRRFGRAAQYEELVENLHQQLSPGALPESLAQRLEEAGPELGALYMYQRGADGERIYRVAAPPRLGSVTQGGDRAYVQRDWPRELAVVDISDPRQPVEIDYIPRESFRRGLTMDGDFAYALEFEGIQAYTVTGYGALLQREKLRLEDPDDVPRIPNVPRDRISVSVKHLEWSVKHLESYRLILAGDHIYAVLNDNLVVFEALPGD